ncbi:murein biosynthesis integral membrane protein MurJ [Desulfosarcina sp. OttesenSCG-928-G10]|nr:murein biosynthesis integral membrane protein MurJ [Desulfosarcina sp. OttesenSCG-928-G10]MDL2321060.1 murein biosynthesis integral membrane protein MurJ [Desulfosarcina sp. OttesenSCG-928-B08]
MSAHSDEPDSENRNVTRAAGVVGAATLLSRIFGYLRDMVVASFFGAGMAADAFITAFRLPNLLRRLFGEGSLSIAFVPVFTETLIRGDRENACRLAISALKLLLLVLMVVTLAGILAAPWIIRVIAPGFAVSPEKLALTITLTQVMFPYIVFIGLVALCMGILNVMGHFAAPAIAPVLLNVAMIGAVVTVSWFSETETVRIMGLAVGVLIGGALQLALQLPYLVRYGIRFWKRSGLWHPAMKQVGLLMLPTIFGAAVYQINILMSNLLASLLAEGSISYLYYADRLIQFPLGIFAQAAATAVLPALSRQCATKDMTGAGDTFSYALSLVLFITLPAMAGLIVLRDPIVTLLFGRGAFDARTTQLTADAVLYYCVGLWAFSAVRIVVSVFYAFQDTRTPVRTAAVSIAVNILLGIILMGPMGHCGLALATSIASMVNLVMLVYVLKKRLGTIHWQRISISAGKTLLASALMAAAVTGLFRLMMPGTGAAGTLRLLLALGVSIGSGVGIFSLAAWMLKIPEWRQMTRLIEKRLLRS